MVERVILVHSDRGRPVDGIRDYSRMLAGEISAHGVDAELRVQPAVGGRSGVAAVARSWREIGRCDERTAVVLQYSPFCFARWGFAPWLATSLLSIRARRRRPGLALMVHEPYVPIDSPQSAAMGGWQRLQLTALRLASDVVFTSIESWAERFRMRWPRRDVRHLPVGSNLPDARGRREEERRRMGVGEETLVVAAMGRDHPSWLGGHVVEAANAIAAAGRPTLLLALGAEAPPLAGLDRSVAVQAPGFLEAEGVAANLAAADLFLAPLVDGVSTRRGTLMAALQHGLPVVATDGPLTDAVLSDAEDALRLVPVGDRAGFAEAAVSLAEDPGGRAATADAGRLLYERNFAWPVVAGDLLAALADR
jgi:glycosyltransferase involved in cell wall biosynthesis